MSLADSALRRYKSDNSLGADEIRALAKRVLELEAERRLLVAVAEAAERLSPFIPVDEPIGAMKYAEHAMACWALWVSLKNFRKLDANKKEDSDHQGD